MDSCQKPVLTFCQHVFEPCHFQKVTKSPGCQSTRRFWPSSHGLYEPFFTRLSRTFTFVFALALFTSISLYSSSVMAEQPLMARNTPLSPDEKQVITQLEKDKTPSPLLLWQLGTIRLKHAAQLYKNWQQNLREDDYQKAILYAESSVKLMPDNDDAWLMLGLLYSEMKAIPEAMEKATDALVHAVVINPANGRAQLLLAQVLMEQSRYWSAIEQFKMLMAESETMWTPAVLSQLTFCYIADGRIQAGLDYISNIPEMTAGDAAARCHWDRWKIINQAVLMRAKGDKHAASYLRIIFSINAPSSDANNDSLEYARYLLALWEQGGAQ